ncbi:hypothetical protein B0T24DRAFT_685837 [Lasiosphaeria ovina]|uniref:Uncharacterized protein n=1 Tax=Lasiosphaeria ovina TaxID=92902 RepID=A0AAE0NIG5_9PEZI|nr:hypothetical protein B0T24DRAFT_685837 [Lasiosphaeria ovina]
MQSYGNPLFLSSAGYAAEMASPVDNMGANRAAVPASGDGYPGPFVALPSQIADCVSGLISSPRVPPHRSGLRPGKSCLKSSAPRVSSSAGSKQVSFQHGEEDLKLRCMITGQVHPPKFRDRKQYKRDIYELREANARAKRKSESEEIVLSEGYEPVMGVSPEQDLEAAQYLAELKELEWGAAMAKVIAKIDKARSTRVPSKKHRHLHPEVVASRRHNRAARESRLLPSLPAPVFTNQLCGGHRFGG